MVKFDFGLNISFLWGKGGQLQTSAGTMGALTEVAESSPFKAPTTASAISIATPSCKKKASQSSNYYFIFNF
jgi:hypothetical protein